MLAPDRMPIVEGKKMANILKKSPSGPLQSGFRFDMRISPGDRQQKTLSLINIKYIHSKADDDVLY